VSPCRKSEQARDDGSDRWAYLSQRVLGCPGTSAPRRVLKNRHEVSRCRPNAATGHPATGHQLMARTRPGAAGPSRDGDAGGFEPLERPKSFQPFCPQVLRREVLGGARQPGVDEPVPQGLSAHGLQLDKHRGKTVEMGDRKETL
jgi:hypothetical protein